MSDAIVPPKSEREPDPETRGNFFGEIRDAALLLEFAVSQGTTLEDGLIQKIKASQEFLAEGAEWPGVEQRVAA